MIISIDFVDFIGFSMHDRQPSAVLFHHIFGRPGAQTMLFAPYDPTYLPFIPILLDIRRLKALIDRDRAVTKGRYCFLPVTASFHGFAIPRREENGCRLAPRFLSNDAIINDMSLLGVGAPFVISDPGHTTLGGLGYGYVYTDRLAQINYSTPDWAGFQATLGIFQGFDGNGVNSADTPGIHGKVNFSWDAALKGSVFATYLSQNVITTAGTSERIQGVDLFATVRLADFSLLGYYFDAEGMSSLAIGGLVLPGFDAVTGDPEEVSGYMAQATYTLGKVRFGINWAQNEQEKVTEVENEKLTFGVYYNFTPALTLLGEYSDQESELKDVGTDASSTYNLGAILFF